MAKYTTQVRSICESFAGKTESVGYKKIDDVIISAIPHIFDSSLKIYDDKYKNVLFSKILRHYYTREICEETVGLWLLRLNNRLHEILPYYNELYKSTLIEFDLFNDVDLRIDRKTTTNGDTTSDKTTSSDKTGVDDVADTRDTTDGVKTNESNTASHTTTRDNNTTTTSSSTGNGTSKTNDVERKLFSETPQGALDNVENETYLTSATKNTKDTNGETTDSMSASGDVKQKDNENVSGNNTRDLTEDRTIHESVTVKRNTSDKLSGTENLKTTVKNTDDYIEHIVGKRNSESYSKLLVDFRKTLINVDMMIIEEISDLFFGLW